MRWTILLVLFLTAALWAQQADQPTEAGADRADTLESRLELVEKALTLSTRTGTSPAMTALETRLSRIEARLDQLERSALRGSSAGGSNNRMLESRLRALEREVSSLRRF